METRQSLKIVKERVRKRAKKKVIKRVIKIASVLRAKKSNMKTGKDMKIE